MRRTAVVVVALALSGCGASLQDVMSATAQLATHGDCALRCAGCIQAIHGVGEGFDAPVRTQASCAADCAQCSAGIARDIAIIAAERTEQAEAAGQDAEPVAAEPLPPEIGDRAIIMALPQRLQVCPNPEVEGEQDE